MLAAAMPWRARDEVLFVSGEFPATIVPWRITERQA
jgi:selenocysteine lyase/cysteine desulfurase